MPPAELTRRDTLTLLVASGAALSFPARAESAAARPPASTAASLLEDIARRLLETDPEQATSLGIDTDAHATLRFHLKDRSPEGVARIAALLREDLGRAEAVGEAALDPATRTSLAVVKTAYRTALDGFALPYGDVAVGGWRNTPYVVIQNVGAYLDTPRFLDSDHPLRNAQDAEAYLAASRAR